MGCGDTGLRVLLLTFAVAGALCALCGDRDCDIYDELSPVTNLGPPENDWASQGIGLPPPGSASTRSKREMLGGRSYGSFESLNEGRKHTESSIPFAYRDVPWEPGDAFQSPSVGASGHYLLLNTEARIDNSRDGATTDYGSDDDRSYSSTGQRLPARQNQVSAPSAEPYDALHGLHSGKRESPDHRWASSTRAAGEEEAGGPASYIEWPVDTDALFQSSNFTFELWVKPAAEQEPFAGLAGTLFSSGPIHSGWGLMLQKERIPSPRTSAFGRPEGGDPRGGGGAAGRKMPVTGSGYEALPAGLVCVHFVVCDSWLEMPGRIDPEVEFTCL